MAQERVDLAFPQPTTHSRPPTLRRPHSAAHTPQGFYPVKPFTIHPGDVLRATCDFDSSGKATATSAGATQEEEVCNLDTMLYGTFAHIAMCAGGGFVVDKSSPGQMPGGRRRRTAACLL